MRCYGWRIHLHTAEFGHLEYVVITTYTVGPIKNGPFGCESNQCRRQQYWNKEQHARYRRDQQIEYSFHGSEFPVTVRRRSPYVESA